MLKPTGRIRNIDHLGRIVIPKLLRDNLNIKQDTPIEISVENDQVYFEKYKHKCVFCNTKDNVKLYKVRYICMDCLSEIHSGFAKINEVYE